MDTIQATGAVPMGGSLPKKVRSVAGGRNFAAWVTPDLALSIALATMFSIFALFHGSTGLFADADTGWHIRNGERMLATGSLSRTDPYSFSRPGQPWVSWEWGADVLMGSVYRGSGLAGIAVLYGLCIGASVWTWFRLNRAFGGNFLITGLFFVPMLATTSLHWLARPHIFSWLFLLGTIWMCERMPQRPGWRYIALATAGTAAWSNLHASFFLAPVIALIYAAGSWLRPVIWEDRVTTDYCPTGHWSGDQCPTEEVSGPHYQPAGGSRWRCYILMALAAFAGTFANPYGWRLHQHVVSYLLNSRLLDRIGEFQSFNFHQEGESLVIYALAICFAGAFAGLAVHKAERFLLSMLLTAMALHSVRAMPVAALLLLPLANGSVTVILRRTAGLAPWLRSKLDDALNYGDRLAAIDRHFRGFAIVPLAAVLIFASVRSSAGFPASQFPVAASAAVASLPISARILSTDSFSGYLIFRFRGERKVFFDGRSDFYGTSILESYARLVQVQPGWRKEFNRWKFTNALLPPDCPLVPLLEAYGWHELYRDSTAVLLTGGSHL